MDNNDVKDENSTSVVEEDTSKETKPKKNIAKLAIEFVKFNLGGLVVTVIEYALYTFLLFLGVPYQISYTSGNIAKIVAQFFINQQVVFKVEKTGDKKADAKHFFLRVLRQVITSLFMLSFKALLVWLVVEFLKIGENAAYFVVLLIETPLSFVLGKFWTYRK